MELWINTIGNEEDVMRLLGDAGFAVKMDPDVINIFHLDDNADRTRAGEILDAAEIAHQWMPKVEGQEEDHGTVE